MEPMGKHQQQSRLPETQTLKHVTRYFLDSLDIVGSPIQVRGTEACTVPTYGLIMAHIHSDQTRADLVG